MQYHAEVAYCSRQGWMRGEERERSVGPSIETVHGRKPGDVFIRRRIPRAMRLRRALGVAALFSTGYGNVGSSIYYALSVTTLYALGAAPLALTIAGLFFILTVLSYTEATVRVPEAGGSSSFARQGFNELFSFIAGWATLLSYTVTIAISSFSAVGYLAVFFPVLEDPPETTIGALVVIAILAVLNVIGVREATALSVFFAVIDLATQVMLVVLGAIFLVNLPQLIGNIHFGVAPTWDNFIVGISVAMVAYTGIETISNMAEEARRPEQSVPRSYGLLILAVLVLFTGISVVALSAMPVTCTNGSCTSELTTTYLEDPVAGIAHHMPEPFRTVLTPLVGVLAFTILVIAANAGVLGVSRLSYSMAAYRQIPEWTYRLHPTFQTPYVAILFFCAVAALLVLPGDITQLADIYIVGAMLTFTMAHLAVIGMRLRSPQAQLAFRIPLAVRVRGRELPLLPAIGGTATFSIFILVIATRPFGRWVGIGWMLAGLAIYAWYRRHEGLSLFETVRRERRRVVT